MRIAIVGDSHAGRIKRTFDRTVRRSPGWSISWFINRSMGSHALRLVGRDEAEIRLDDFLLVEDTVFCSEDHDLVICVGMGADIRRAMILAKQFSHPGIGATSPRHLTSETWESALSDVLTTTPAMQLISILRKVSPELPILYSPPVRPMSWINARPGHIKDWSTNILHNGHPKSLSRVWSSAVHQICEEFGVLFVDQPDDTITDHCWSLPKFGYAKHNDPQDKFWANGDYFHANDLYAMKYIDLLRRLPVLDELPSTYAWPEYL